MKRVSLSLAAEQDLDEIDDYTIEHFGLDQAITTTERFRETFRDLAEMSLSGHLRPDLSPRGRTFRYRTLLRSSMCMSPPMMAFVSLVYFTVRATSSPSSSGTQAMMNLRTMRRSGERETVV